ncbi:MAG: DUF1320 family protein [Gammaproteobacteria bacterium]|nr:DUF1320 family protein [Gammaproteobacteria bacterium]
MGNYASRAELIARFTDELETAHLTGSADTGSADIAVLDEVIGKAEGEVDASAAQKFSVPLDVAGDTILGNWIKSIVLDLAVAFLHARSGNVPEPVANDRDHVRAWLKELVTGTVQLPSARTEATTVSRDPVSVWGTAGTGDSSKRVFSRATQEQL